MNDNETKASSFTFSWKAILAFWALIALISLSVNYVHSTKMPNMSLRGGLFLISYLLWALLTPFIFSANRWVNQKNRSRVVAWTLLLSAGLLISFSHSVLEEVIFWFTAYHTSQYAQTPEGLFFHFILPEVHIKFLIFCAILGAGAARDYYQRFHERNLRVSKLEAQLTKAKLEALKMQLHPHFLFNTLNTISAYVERNPKEAKRMIARLSDLLRLTLEMQESQTVTLEHELAFIKRYLEIEQIRFQDRMQVTIHADSQALPAQVPNMILQPVVENAVRHGISRRLEGGHIKIEAQKENGFLAVEIHDDGPGMLAGESREPGSGIGLKNTEARLQQFYGDNYRFKLKSDERGTGFSVAISLPFYELESE